MAVRNISDIQNLTNYIIRKQRGAYQTFDEIDNMLHFGQLDLYEMYWNIYLETGIVPQALEQFKNRFSFSNSTSPNGILAKPSDYGKFLNGYTIIFDNQRNTSKRCKLVPINEDEVVDAINSQLRPVSVNRPLILQGSNNFILYPQQSMAGEINYLKIPVAPVFAYTQSGRVITYNPSASIQLLWSDIYINQVILKALSYIGINLNEATITQYSESKAKEIQ